MHYYYKKYPFLHYSYVDYDGRWTMFSVPPDLLSAAFVQRFNYKPKTFFDCGAATGEIVYRAQMLGMDAHGVDVREYPYQNPQLAKLFVDKKIDIKSILDCEPINADLAYCNGTLTYFSESELPSVLKKFSGCKMLVAIHNTTEDIIAAESQGDILTTCNKLRLIKPHNWWMNTFENNGFNTEYDKNIQCFCAMFRGR